jgi:hypothetical protein
MLEAFTDPPARCCYFTASETESPRFQRVAPDLSCLACARVLIRTSRPWACIAAEHTAGVDVGVLNLTGPEKMGLHGGGNATTFLI